MNVGSFIYDGRPQYGVFRDETIEPAGPALKARYPTLRHLLDGGQLEALEDRENLSGPVPIAEIMFLPPIPNPRKIICVGMNYVKPYPVGGIAPASPESIILFGKEREALVGHGARLEIPKGTAADSFDFEGEIAAVIGKAARHVPVAQAVDHLLGYAAFNDGSVRDWQRHSIYAGKNFANSGSWGPWITTVDALPPAEELHLRVALNGKVMQSAYGHEMIFSLAEQIAYASSLFTLHPGDVIATGSPDGTGGSRSPKRYLKSGDVLSVSVEGVGTLTSTVS